MNQILEEMNDVLTHYGVKRRSGRYPWGSGDNGYQRDNRDLLGRIEMLKRDGWTETAENVRAEFGIGLKEYREQKAIAKNERLLYRKATAERMRDKEGKGYTEIGRELGVPESTVRGWFNEGVETRARKAQSTADFIREQIDKKGMIDVGTGVEKELGISKEKLNQAIAILEEEGYPIYKGGIPQVTNKGQQTNQKVICPPGTEHKAIYEFDKVHPLNEDNYTSRDGGETFEKFRYPASMDSKRMHIRYAEDGGVDKDGIVEIRRGVPDLSLGESHYSQVRILVDDKYYIKGMAVYSDKMPDGVDVVFNTNKTKDVPMQKVLKEIKNDPDNPFGSLIKANGQSEYVDANGKKQLSLINKRADQGDWDEWQDALPSQFLGKQALPLAKRQLKLAKEDKQSEFDAICELTNPTVKKHLLEEFASNCDAAAVHLKAAALPGQKYHVIIPVNTLKDDEVYAPNYNDGEKIALIRYPHGGTFEIPILTVNNKHSAAKKVIGPDSIDAVCINKKNADRLSGADFDGDTVMCIPTHNPNSNVKITSTPELRGLKGFDPKDKYPEVPGMQYMSKRGTQTQMGIISNLITDMTLGGRATEDELAAAVRHSMVVIDAHKHKLNYKQSEIDNDIAGLKKKYQRTVLPDGTIKEGGASTILSRAKSQESVLKRQGSPKVNIKGKEWYDPDKPEGALVYTTADDLYYTTAKVSRRSTDAPNATIRVSKKGKRYAEFDDTGEWIPIDGKSDITDGSRVTASRKTNTRMQESTKMAETDDAYKLVSDAKHPMEMAYADYANTMKALANRARKEMVSTGKIETSKQAQTVYEKEVKSLNAKLNDALKNSPKERAAQRMANASVNAKKEAGTLTTSEDIKKESQRALSAARVAVGSVSRRDRNIPITEREWEAIQAGAISENKLKQILNNTDTAVLRKYATPRTTTTLTPAKVNKIKALQASNLTLSQIADIVGVSTSTVSNYLKGGN